MAPLIPLLQQSLQRTVSPGASHLLTAQNVNTVVSGDMDMIAAREARTSTQNADADSKTKQFRKACVLATMECVRIVKDSPQTEAQRAASCEQALSFCSLMQ